MHRLGRHRSLHELVDQFFRCGRQRRLGFVGRSGFAWHTCSWNYMLCLPTKFMAGPRRGALPSFADPTATHAVRSGMNEHFVTGDGYAREGLVSDHYRSIREVDTYKLAV